MKNNHQYRGFTLVEVMIAVFITTLLSIGISQSFILLSKNFMSVGNYVDLSAQSRYSLEVFGRDMRMAARVYKATSTAIDVDIMTPSGAENVTYVYNSGTGEFTRTSAAGSQVILRNCDELELTYFTILDSPTTTLSSVKKVRLSAVTRRWVQNVENTDHLITATYMMRNRNVAN